MVLVDEVVAVELENVSEMSKNWILGTYHIEAIPWRISSNDIDLLVSIQPHDVFECDCMID